MACPTVTLLLPLSSVAVQFTALCPITGQHDFGHLVIRYVPNKLCVESKALKLYLFSFRNHGTFHEAVVNRVLDDLVRAVRRSSPPPPPTMTPASRPYPI